MGVAGFVVMDEGISPEGVELEVGMVEGEEGLKGVRGAVVNGCEDDRDSGEENDVADVVTGEVSDQH